jgi:hypothetical protein
VLGWMFFFLVIVNISIAIVLQLRGFHRSYMFGMRVILIGHYVNIKLNACMKN